MQYSFSYFYYGVIYNKGQVRFLFFQSLRFNLCITYLQPSYSLQKIVDMFVDLNRDGELNANEVSRCLRHRDIHNNRVYVEY